MDSWYQRLPAQFYDQLIAFLPKAAAGVLIFTAFWIFSIFIRLIITGLLKRTNTDRSLIALLSKSAGITVVVFGAVTALGTAGLDVGALIAGLGLSGFALGFAFKDGLSNILAGISILFYRPFRIGDYIAVSGLEGRVTDIDLRYTTLATKDKKLLIPNSNLLVNPIQVFDLPPA